MPGLVDVRPWHWERYEERGAGQLVLFFWASPHAGVSEVDRVEVAEDPERVVITLYVGRDPDLTGWYTLEAREKAVAVALPSPLGARTVVAGSP